MRDAYQLLEEKEADLARVRHEIESLRIVSPLLTDDVHIEPDPSKKRDNSSEKAEEEKLESKATGTDGLPVPESKHKFWNVLKREK